MPALAQRRAKIAVRQLNLPRADCFPFPRGARLIFVGGRTAARAGRAASSRSAARCHEGKLEEKNWVGLCRLTMGRLLRLTKGDD